MSEQGATGSGGANQGPDGHDTVTVGPYTLLSRIGEGGMGVVHLAERSDGTRVAIKLLRPHVVGDDHGRARMAREVTSLRRVRSPRVAGVYDADPWGDMPYVVVRYVAGPSLHDHVERHGPIVGEDLIVFARGLAEALVAVHQADVLHRDVKPSNVLLEGRNPVLIDFGLAQLSDDSRLTHSGWLLGTPGYLAPEILYGDDPTLKADVHSWAATLVFAATGHGPYGKGPAVAVMDRVRRGEYNLSGLPNELYWIVTRALMPDPRERPTSGQLLEWMTGPAVAPPQQAMPPPRDQSLIETPPVRFDPSRTLSPDVQPAPQSQPPAPGLVSVPGPERVAYAEPAAAGGHAPSPDPRPFSPMPSPIPGGQPTERPAYRSAPAYRSDPAPAAAGVFWLGVLALVVVGAVLAPAITALVAFGVAWLLRTLTFRGRRLEQWRRERGVQQGDGMVATTCLPWFGILTLPKALLNGGVAVLDGAIVVIIATVATDPRRLVPVLAVGGLVTALFTWWGPFSADVREGGRIIARNVLPGIAGLLVIALVALSAAGLLIVRQVAGPHYAPLPHPPWEQQLRDLVN